VRRRSVELLGRPWIFWPVVLCVGLSAKRAVWGPTWVWLGVLVLVGPVLGVVLWWVTERRTPRAPGPALQRVLTHFRGRDA